MEHTPTPWEVIETFDYDFQIYPKGNVEAGHNQIAVIPATGDGDDKANATHIVHCVNLHDELVAALSRGLDYIEADEASHGRKFGIGNEFREVLNKCNH